MRTTVCMVPLKGNIELARHSFAQPLLFSQIFGVCVYKINKSQGTNHLT